MTTATKAPAAEPDLSTPAAAGVTMPRVLTSEWIKLRSLRSTWYSLGAALVISIGLGILISALRGHDFATHDHHSLGEQLDPAAVSLRGMFLAQLAVGVLGVLIITGEYSTGMIRASLSAVPRRTPVLVAKAIVFGVTTFVVATIASLVAFLGGQAALGANHLGVSLSDPGSLRVVIGGGLYLTVVGLLALGCGFALRNTGGAIATLFGLLLVLPILANALPQSWQNDINKFLPMNAGSTIMTTVHDSTNLSPWAGIGVFALYALAALVVGLIVLRRKDA